jgi:hypothetical protein
MKTVIRLLVICITVSVVPCAVADSVLVGAITNKYGGRLSSLSVRVSGAYNTNVVTDRSGTFRLGLSAGEWSVQPDNAAIQNLGYSEVPAQQVILSGQETNTLNFLVIASEPPWRPVILSTYIFSNQFEMRIAAQGGRRYEIHESTNLVAWRPIPYSAFTVTTGGIVEGFGAGWFDKPHYFFRVAVLE